MPYSIENYQRYKERICAAQKRYYDNNKDKIRKRNAEYRQKHLTRIRKYNLKKTKQWYAKNRDKLCEKRRIWYKTYMNAGRDFLEAKFAYVIYYESEPIVAMIVSKEKARQKYEDLRIKYGTLSMTRVPLIK